MSLEYIYVTRHGFRSNWVVNPTTGDYTGFIPSPTGHPADPALTAHGVSQSRELAAHLARRPGEPGRGRQALPAPIERIYSSPYYRCLQTIQPYVERPEGPCVVRCDPGLVDWFGPAPFEQPQPAPLHMLRDDFFPWIDLGYQHSGAVPRLHGESMAQLHARVAAALQHIVQQCDAEGVRAIVVCAHAAPIIAMGRVLTGVVPDDVATEDFGAFTCGLTTFRRRSPRRPPSRPHAARHVPWDDPFHTLAGEAWIGGRGVGGGWECEVNCDCSFLSEGEERGWRFSGDDEAFAGGASSLNNTDKKEKRPIVDAGLELGVVVEGGGRQQRQPGQQGRDNAPGRQRSADRTLAQPEPLQGAGGGGGSGDDDNDDDNVASRSDTSAGVVGGDRRGGGRGGDDLGRGSGGKPSARL